ncbi:MAG: hypothetical protein FWH52_04245 [Synergistaceae bacterium]|nr:hypothetical protein [Synergistaceae bacterium]
MKEYNATEEMKLRYVREHILEALSDIENDNVEDGDTFFLEMMQALVVLEYNGNHWHDVHPLVSDFLKESVMDGQKINQ